MWCRGARARSSPRSVPTDDDDDNDHDNDEKKSNSKRQKRKEISPLKPVKIEDEGMGISI